MFAFVIRHPLALSAAVLLHVVIAIGLVFGSFDDDPILKVTLQSDSEEGEITQVKQVEPMKTFAVDSALVKEQLAKIKQQEEAKRKEQEALKKRSEAEKRRLADLQKQQLEEKRKTELAKKQALAEKRRAEEAKRQAQIEKQRVAAEQKRAAEAKRLAEQAKKEAVLAEKKREEAKKLVAAAEKQRQEEEAKKRALQEQIKKQNAEKKRLEEAALQARLQKEQQEAETALQQQIAAEEAKRRQAAKEKEMQSLRETYISSIAASVKDNWRTAAKVSDEAQCVLSITQTPKGMISGVKVEQCNKFANEQFQKDAVKAVYRAEPLPAPPVKELFERNIKFIFNP